MILQKIRLRYDVFIKLIILVSPLTAYAVIPTVPGTVPAYLLILILMGLYFCIPLLQSPRYKKTLIQFALFVGIYAAYTLLSQISSWVFPVTIPKDIILIDNTDYLTLIFRGSLFTQSAYLICNVFLYIIIKNYATSDFIKPIHWAFRALIIYGLYEYIFFLIFGTSGDFISNRIYSNQDDGVIGGSFQLQNIGSATFFRMKSFTGEPSMFSFTILPYFALTVGLKKRWESIICFICILLTFSTTAYLGLVVYMLYQIFFSSNKKLKYILLSIIAGVAAILGFLLATNDFLLGLVNLMFVDKLSGQDMSGSERSGSFFATLNFWKNSDPLHFLFGYGFGFARSTDFLSTLLFNVGIVGFLAFTAFIFGHFLIPIKDRSLRENYRAALVVLYFIMMASVPEFAYCSFWVILASGYVFKNYGSEPQTTIN